MDLPSPPITHATSRRKLYAIPIVAIAIFVLSANLWSIIYRATWPSPLTPWESAYIIASETVARGGDIYSFPGDPKSGIGVRGPAAVMYGPVTPFLLGMFVKAFGSWPYYGRSLSLLAAAGLAILAISLQPRRSAVAVLITVTLVAAVHWRSRSFFTDARPDMLAWFLGALSLFAFYRAHDRRQWIWYLPGTVIIVAAFLTKQTASIYAFVPLAAVLFTTKPRATRELAMAAVPIIAIALTVVLMKLVAPNFYHYAVRMPSFWPIRWMRVWDASANAITFDPLFAICAGIWLVRPELLKNRAMAWLLVTSGLGILGGAVFFAKTGGSQNSYIPAWLPNAAFSAAVLTWLVTQTELPARLHALAVAIIAPIALLTSAVGIPRGFEFVLNYQHGHRNYAKVIDLARSLPGTVVCPEDPTIAWQAKGKLNRTFTVEIESIQNRYIPHLMQEEMYTADWIIWVNSPYTELLTTADLERLGFALQQIERLEPNTYQVWQRDRSLAPKPLKQGVGQPRVKSWPTTTRNLPSIK